MSRYKNEYKDYSYDEINNAIKTVKDRKTFSSKDYTYGNLYKNV